MAGNIADLQAKVLELDGIHDAESLASQDNHTDDDHEQDYTIAAIGLVLAIVRARNDQPFHALTI
eukprot:1177595-Prorocentrum_minimum.AAC.2